MLQHDTAPVTCLGTICGCSGAGAAPRRGDTARGGAVSSVHVPARCAHIRSKQAPSASHCIVCSVRTCPGQPGDADSSCSRDLVQRGQLCYRVRGRSSPCDARTPRLCRRTRLEVGVTGQAVLAPPSPTRRKATVRTKREFKTESGARILQKKGKQGYDPQQFLEAAFCYSWQGRPPANGELSHCSKDTGPEDRNSWNTMNVSAA